ncbi:MAG TPA: ABC transporter substrate-binding protein [Burkholderiales bacterium]|nr:ABC transporter substrate-binding protein [Burkholderiales bacterium]
MSAYRFDHALNRYAFLILLVAFFSNTSHAQLPPGYAASYSETIAAAKKEGKLVIYAATDLAAATPLIRDFQAMYSGIQVEYHDMNTTELYDRFTAEISERAESADVLWSSAMDLQMKLVNDGYAQAYRSPEAPRLPEWAVWRYEAFATTFEPVVFVYNKRLLAADEVPQSHPDLMRLLKSKAQDLEGKIATYDIEKSGVGFLLITQDSRTSPAFWSLIKTLGATGVRLQPTTTAMVERIASGEYLLGYNLLGSYAMDRAAKNPAIGVVLPADYTLVMSRVMFISKSAKHPNAARLWTDYVLSRRGQTVLAAQSNLSSIRSDVEGESTSAAISKKLGASLKPIAVGPGLLVYLDHAKRQEFLKQWRQALGIGK